MDIIQPQFKGTVFEKGYGLIPQVVMRDTRLKPPAKAIYAYMCAFAGSGTDGFRKAYPGVEIMCAELEMSENTFYKHRKILMKTGYIKVEKQRQMGSKFDNNVYELCLFPKEINLDELSEKVEEPHRKNSGMEEEPHRNFPRMEKPCMENPCMENSGAISISSISISSISNIFKNVVVVSELSEQEKEIRLQEQLKAAITFFETNGFGTVGSFIMQAMTSWIIDFQYNAGLVVYAMEQAVTNGRKNWKYTEGVLKRIVDKKIMTVEEALAAEQARKEEQSQKAPSGGYRKQGSLRQEKTPEWFGKEDQSAQSDEDAEFLAEKARLEAELANRDAAKPKREEVE